MDFINLEDGYPEKDGNYTVKIESTSGKPRLAPATWNENDGFTLTDTALDNEEYIAYWKPYSSNINERFYSEKDLISAAKYGYEYRHTTSFPELSFEDNCENNVKQWIAGVLKSR